MQQAPAHSTLAYANQHRPWEVYETLFTEGANVLSDETIVLQQATAKNQSFFRVVQYWDETTQRQFQFLTNHHTLPAETIAAIYRERWQVELFFKALKQNLRSRASWAPPPTR